jgi:hypothetical protein
MLYDNIDFSWKSFFDVEIQNEYFIKLISDVENEYETSVCFPPKHLIFNAFEGQIDTGNMMQELLKKAISNNILILNHQNLLKFEDHKNSVTVQLEDISFTTKKLFQIIIVLLCGLAESLFE